MTKLNPLLRLAAISGVEVAVDLHIRRGDNLNARDGSGATPLILAAARGRTGVVRRLLVAGADPELVDLRGKDALAHALASGCRETVEVLTDALTRTVGEHRATSYSTQREGAVATVMTACESASGYRTNSAVDEGLRAEGRQFCIDSPAVAVTCPGAHDSGETNMVDDNTVARITPGVSALGGDSLDATIEDDWEAEPDQIAPVGDESVVAAARHVHRTIDKHIALDRDEDWSDVDIDLPDRAIPLERELEEWAVRAFLLAALRGGVVSEGELAEACENSDGTRNEDSERLLRMVVGELGAIVVEWNGDNTALVGEPSLEEERSLDEATEYFRDLASGRNDPSRFYAKGLRGGLLGAQEEAALGREMEAAGRDALHALARWPEGLAVLFDAADRVIRGEEDAGRFTTALEPSDSEERALPADVSDEDDDTALDIGGGAFPTAVAAVRAAGPNVDRIAEALEAVQLTSGFLTNLASRASQDCAGAEFADAVNRQSVARERMILCNLRLAMSVAKKYLRSGVPFDDLVQEANIGLMKAVERYDWRKGYRFSTYATWWIRQRITRSIADTSRVVRVPVHLQEDARRIVREREQVEARTGRRESMCETSRRLGISLPKTVRLLSALDDAVSLDATDPETGLTGLDLLVDPEAADPAEFADRASLCLTVMKMLNELDEKSRQVIVLRFGMEGDDAMTLEEVGHRFGVTRERIRQIEAKALKRLSQEKRREILAPFMGDAYLHERVSSGPTSTLGSRPSAATRNSGASGEREEASSARKSVRHDSSLVPQRRGIENSVAGKSERARTLGREGIRLHFEESSSEPALEDSLATRLCSEARVLGLDVDDSRIHEGKLRIVAPIDSSPEIMAFRQRLLASGFRMVRRDVFAK